MKLKVYKGEQVKCPPDSENFHKVGVEFLKTIIQQEQEQGIEGEKERENEKKFNYLEENFIEQIRLCSKLKGRCGEEDFIEFLTTGKSHNRHLEWIILNIPSNCSYPLHAHPVMEAMYVFSGSCHELRLKQINNNNNIQPEQRSFPLDCQEGPDITKYNNNEYFEENCYSEGDFFINESGSIHQSFTAEDTGCILFGLWGGCHMNICDEKVSKEITILKNVSVDI